MRFFPFVSLRVRMTKSEGLRMISEGLGMTINKEGLVKAWENASVILSVRLMVRQAFGVSSVERSP
jgi:hypothetical protein